MQSRIVGGMRDAWQSCGSCAEPLWMKSWVTRNARAQAGLRCLRADSEPGPAALSREAPRFLRGRHRAPPAVLRSLRLDRRHEHARQRAAVAANGGEFRRHGDQRRRVPVNRAQCPHQKAVSCHDALRVSRRVRIAGLLAARGCHPPGLAACHPLTIMRAHRMSKGVALRPPALVAGDRWDVTSGASEGPLSRTRRDPGCPGRLPLVTRTRLEGPEALWTAPWR